MDTERKENNAEAERGEDVRYSGREKERERCDAEREREWRMRDINNKRG